jgi:hypothetical protein
MKRALLITLLFSFSIIAKSQIAWCDTGATWYYGHSVHSTTGYLLVKYTGDTLINSVVTKKLNMHQYLYDYVSKKYFNGSQGNLFTYTINKVVYLYNQSTNSFDTLCNFNAKIGDKWKTATSINFTNCDGIVTVIDTGTTFRFGKSLKWIYTDNYWWPNIQFKDTIYERIGYFRWGPFPNDYCHSQFDAHTGGYLRCYSDTNFSTYNKQTNSCNFIVNSILENAFSKIKFYPNPASNLLNFENLPINEKVNYNIYALNGKIIQQGAINSSQIDISSFENGVYFLEINIEGKSKKYKVVKTN